MKAPGARIATLVNSHAKGRPLHAGEAAARVKAGLPIGEFDALRELLGLTVEGLAGKIGVSIATLSRRRHSGQPLDAGRSDRLLRYARLFRLAVELHDGDEVAAPVAQTGVPAFQIGDAPGEGHRLDRVRRWHDAGMPHRFL